MKGNEILKRKMIMIRQSMTEIVIGRIGQDHFRKIFGHHVMFLRQLVG